MEANVISKPKTLIRTQNTILISWDNVFANVTDDAKYVLQIENDFREWKNVYWGSKKQFLVDGLAPCNCYNLRLKYCNQECDSEWINFKSATDAVPYFVMHFTRAVKFGKTPVIRKIINRRSVLMETENKEGKTPLIQAVEAGNLQMVMFLINLGANVNTATLITKRTPLMVALFNDNLQISNLLVDKGANLFARDCNSLTGLHHAVDSGSFENVKFCLDHGFEINVQDNKGWTPLVRAVILNCSDEIISLLLERGADPKIKDKSGFDFCEHLNIISRTYFANLVVNSLEKQEIEPQQEYKETKNEEKLQES